METTTGHGRRGLRSEFVGDFFAKLRGDFTAHS